MRSIFINELALRGFSGMPDCASMSNCSAAMRRAEECARGLRTRQSMRRANSAIVVVPRREAEGRTTPTAAWEAAKPMTLPTDNDKTRKAQRGPHRFLASIPLYARYCSGYFTT
jgi:hypothetical protein